MRSGTKIVRLCGLLAAFYGAIRDGRLSQILRFPEADQRTDGPPDHSGPGAGMAAMGGGMGGMGMP